jgi:hypothetical protein
MKLKKNMRLRKEIKKNQANSSEPPKPGLILKTHNLWKPKLGLNQETQFLTNITLNDEIKKTINLKKLPKWKNSNKKNGEQI